MLRSKVRELQERNRALSSTLETKKYAQFVLRTDDNEQATTSLVKFLKDNAFDVTRYRDKLLLIKYGGGNFLIQPKVSKGNLSRLIVTKIYNIKPQYRKTSEILAYVLKLNQKFNVATFSLSYNFEKLIMRGSITFVDKVDAKEIREFMELINKSVLAILVTMPETIKYLR